MLHYYVSYSIAINNIVYIYNLQYSQTFCFSMCYFSFNHNKHISWPYYIYEGENEQQALYMYDAFPYKPAALPWILGLICLSFFHCDIAILAPVFCNHC